jgi:hypothetical protein
MNRAHRRRAGAMPVELDHRQRAGARQQIERIEKRLQRIDEKLLPEQAPHVEPSTSDKSGRSTTEKNTTTNVYRAWPLKRVEGFKGFHQRPDAAALGFTRHYRRMLPTLLETLQFRSENRLILELQKHQAIT